MDRLLIAVFAFAGGLIIALLGWLDSEEPFDKRKFGGSVIRSLLAGIVFAISYPLANGIGMVDIFYSLLGGAGFDTVINRVAGAFGKGSFPI